MKQSTQWQHYVRNHYLILSIGFVLASGFMYYEIEEGVKWAALIPFTIGAILIPLFNYLSWSGKMR